MCPEPISEWPFRLSRRRVEIKSYVHGVEAACGVSALVAAAIIDVMAYRRGAKHVDSGLGLATFAERQLTGVCTRSTYVNARRRGASGRRKISPRRAAT